MTGTIDDNTIGIACGATNSGCFVSACDGISLTDSATQQHERLSRDRHQQPDQPRAGRHHLEHRRERRRPPRTSFVITGNTFGNPDRRTPTPDTTAFSSIPARCRRPRRRPAWRSRQHDERRLGASRSTTTRFASATAGPQGPRSACATSRRGRRHRCLRDGHQHLRRRHSRQVRVPTGRQPTSFTGGTAACPQ